AAASVARRLWRFSRRQPVGAASALVLVAMVLAAVLADIIAPYDPIDNNVGPILAGPSGAHWFGTDAFGRDLFSRVVHGARTSLYVGLGATFLGVIGAGFIGAVSGYVGGYIDYACQRVVDAAQAVPPLILLIGVMIILGPSALNVVLALTFR